VEEELLVRQLGLYNASVDGIRCGSIASHETKRNERKKRREQVAANKSISLCVCDQIPHSMTAVVGSSCSCGGVHFVPLIDFVTRYVALTVLI